MPTESEVLERIRRAIAEEVVKQSAERIKKQKAEAASSPKGFLAPTDNVVQGLPPFVPLKPTAPPTKSNGWTVFPDNDRIEITVDKKLWKMSIPKEKENEDKFSIVFDRKQDAQEKEKETKF